MISLLIVQTDCSTENGNIAAGQCYFRANATDEYAGDKGMVNQSETNILKHGGLVSEKADHRGG